MPPSATDRISHLPIHAVPTPADAPSPPVRRRAAAPILHVVTAPQDRLSIRHWPAQERPRERLARLGPCGLSDAELLALFIRTGLPGRSAVDIARALLLQYGSLTGVLQASDSSLETVAGIGPAKRAQLQAIQETVRRALGETLRETGATLDSATAVSDFLRLKIGNRSQEVFVALFLDVRCRLLAAEEMAHGTVSRSAVYPREIGRRALQLNATSLIVAHNHPSGMLHPSAEDKALTGQLKQALALLDIALLDHLIVGAHGHFSFADHGILS